MSQSNDMNARRAADARQRSGRRRTVGLVLLLVCGSFALSAAFTGATAVAADALPPSCGADGLCVDPPPAGNGNDGTGGTIATTGDAPVPPAPSDPAANPNAAPDVVISSDGTKAVAAASAKPAHHKLSAGAGADAGADAYKFSARQSAAPRAELPYTGVELRALAMLGGALVLAGCIVQVLPTTRGLRAAHSPN